METTKTEGKWKKKKGKEKEVPSKELMKLALAHGKLVRSQGEEGLNKILILSKKKKQQDFDDILMEHGSHLPTVASTTHSHFFFPNFHLIFFVGNSI